MNNMKNMLVTRLDNLPRWEANPEIKLNLYVGLTDSIQFDKKSMVIRQCENFNPPPPPPTEFFISHS